MLTEERLRKEAHSLKYDEVGRNPSFEEIMLRKIYNKQSISSTMRRINSYPNYAK